MIAGNVFTGTILSFVRFDVIINDTYMLKFITNALNML